MAGKTVPGHSYYASEEPTKYPGVFKYTIKDPDLEIGGGPIIPPIVDPDAPRPTHPIALPGDPWWGGDLKPTHPIVLPPDGEGPPTVEEPVVAFIAPLESTEPMPTSVELAAGSTRVMMYFGLGTIAFEWFLPPIATPKKK